MILLCTPRVIDHAILLGLLCINPKIDDENLVSLLRSTLLGPESPGHGQLSIRCIYVTSPPICNLNPETQNGLYWAQIFHMCPWNSLL